MTDQQIIDLFDSTNITLSELSAISGRSVADLKQLLIAQDAESYRYGGP